MLDSINPVLYSMNNLAWLTYAHFLIFVVPAMGLGISLLRDEFLHRGSGYHDADIFPLTPGPFSPKGGTEKKAA